MKRSCSDALMYFNTAFPPSFERHGRLDLHLCVRNIVFCRIRRLFIVSAPAFMQRLNTILKYKGYFLLIFCFYSSLILHDFSPDYSQILPIEPGIEYFRSFSVVPPCEAFASLFSYAVFDYRQKNRSNTLASIPVSDFMNNPR